VPGILCESISKTNESRMHTSFRSPQLSPSQELQGRLLARSLATIVASGLGVLAVQFGAALDLPKYLPHAILTAAGLNWAYVAYMAVKLVRQRPC